MASLGTVGIADKGKYSADVAYFKGNFVYHNGSSWLALKDNLTGVTPEEGENWKYLARGYAAELLSMITALDTSGVLGEAGASVSAQSLIDYLTDSVMNNLVKKNDISNVQLNDPSKVPSSALAYAMKEEMNAVNNNKIENLKWTQTVDYVNNFRLPGIAFFMIDAAVAQKIDLPGTSWWYVMHISKTDGSGFAVQIFYELGGQGQTCRRWSSDTSWIGRSW